MQSTDNRWVASLRITPQTFPSGATLGYLVVQVWAQREDDLRVRLRSPNGDLFEVPAGSEREFDHGSFIVEATHQRAVYSDDHTTTFEIFTLPQNQLLRGWSIIVEPRTANGIRAGCVHAWILDEAMGLFVEGETRSHLVGMPGTSFSAITVASYATRDAWQSQAGPINLSAMNLEDISYFSSLGPTRDAHNKPEISGPGQWIISTLSADATLSEMPQDLRLPGGRYAALQGTSMAAPYVTGAVALLLQKSSNLDWAEVKRRLIKSAKVDQHTGCAWNRRWGYGKLDVGRLLSVEPE